jgi:hypothetical protein
MSGIGDERDQGDEFTAAQEGDYVPDDGPVDDEERPIDDESDQEFPDDERVVVLDDGDDESESGEL